MKVLQRLICSLVCGFALLGAAYAGTTSVDLYNDDGTGTSPAGMPIANLGKVDDAAMATGDHVYTFPATGVALTGNTYYWVVLSTINGAAAQWDHLQQRRRRPRAARRLLADWRIPWQPEVGVGQVVRSIPDAAYYSVAFDRAPAGDRSRRIRGMALAREGRPPRGFDRSSSSRRAGALGSGPGAASRHRHSRGLPGRSQRDSDLLDP